MEVKGLKRIAMLLMSLDMNTASELLRSVPKDDVQEIVLELARIDASDIRDTKEELTIAQEFYNTLVKKQAQRFSVKAFLNDNLSTLFGKAKADEIKEKIRNETQKRDPFIDIRSATTDELVLALDGQHPQTIAAVLGGLTPAKGQEVLALLNEETRRKTACRMTTLDQMNTDMKQRIATMVAERLKGVKGEVLPEGREQTLRRLAMVLGGLDRKVRDDLLETISEQDEESATMVRNLMVTWEDIPSIADRSLQECLRNVDISKLAIALYETDETIAEKIRSNLSERAVAMLDEEISLMQEPLEKEVLDAKEEIVRPLREANEEGTLRTV